MSSFNQPQPQQQQAVVGGAVEAFGGDDMHNDSSQHSNHSHGSHHSSHHHQQQRFTSAILTSSESNPISPCGSVEYNEQQQLHHLHHQRQQQQMNHQHHHPMMPMMTPSSSSFYSSSTSSSFSTPPQGSLNNLQSTSTKGAASSSGTATTTTTTTIPPKKGNKKKPGDKPKRPLSAYNLFFQLERERLLSGDDDENPRVFTPQDVANMVIAHQNKPKRPHRKTHGKIGFAELARLIAARWKKLDKSGRTVFEERAKLEKTRYRVKVADWLERQTTRDKSKEKLLAMMPAGPGSSPSQVAASARGAAGSMMTQQPAPGSISRKVSLEHTTAVRSPESPMYLVPNNNGNGNMMNGVGSNSMSSLSNGSNSCSSNNNNNMNNNTAAAHVVPPYTPPRKVSMVLHPNNNGSNNNCSSSSSSMPVAAFPGQLDVPNFNASSNVPNAHDNNNLRDLLSQGDAYLREDSHMARLQKLHAMQVQMEQELHQMAMEQGYFNNNNTGSNNNNATPSNVGSSSGFYNESNNQGSYGGYNNNNMLNSMVDLPSTMGVNGLSLPPLPRLTNGNEGSTNVVTGNSFLMPKQQQREEELFQPVPSSSSQQGPQEDQEHDDSWKTHLDPHAGLSSPTLELDHPIDADHVEPVAVARDDVVVDDDDEDNLHLF